VEGSCCEQFWVFYHSRCCMEELRKVSHSGLKTKHGVSENEAGMLIHHAVFGVCSCVYVYAPPPPQVKKWIWFAVYMLKLTRVVELDCQHRRFRSTSYVFWAWNFMFRNIVWGVPLYCVDYCSLTSV
jgi:hypothetical protein